MSFPKPFLSINDQIELLRERKLEISDEEFDRAKEFFINNNYYRISGYTLTLRRDDIFFKNSSLDLKSLVNHHDFMLVKEHILQIYENYNHIDFSHYGFPENWKSVL